MKKLLMSFFIMFFGVTCYSANSNFIITDILGNRTDILYHGIINYVRVSNGEEGNITQKADFVGFDLVEWDSVDRFYRLIPVNNKSLIIVNGDTIPFTVNLLPPPVFELYNQKLKKWVSTSDSIFVKNLDSVNIRVSFPKNVQLLNLDNTEINYDLIEGTILTDKIKKSIDIELIKELHNSYKLSFNNLDEKPPGKVEVFVILGSAKYRDPGKEWVFFGHHPSFKLIVYD